MEENRSLLYRILHPRPAVVLICVLICVIGEGYVFIFEKNNHPMAYVIYLFSVYALIISVIGIGRLSKSIRDRASENRLPLVKSIKERMNRHAFTRRYLNDRDYRALVGVYVGLTANLIYAAMKSGVGIYLRSLWFFGIGVYYIVLASIRLILVLHERRQRTYTDEAARELAGYKSYRLCGCMMMVMDLTILGLLIQMIYQNKTYEYPGLMIYASALFAFYFFITAIVNLVKFRGNKNPILTASKDIAFAGASMSILALQTAMISTFGTEDRDFAVLMNSITGGIICVFVLGMATYMIINGTNKINGFIKS